MSGLRLDLVSVNPLTKELDKAIAYYRLMIFR
jgi:hypothetical protein